MSANLSLWTKFWLGAVMPTIALALIVAATVAGGHDRGEAPLLLFFASLGALPAVLLLNSWVLFVAWSSRVSMMIAAFTIPAIVALSGVLVVHGTGHWHEAGIFMLLPFLAIPVTSPRALGIAWAVGLLVVLWAAHAVQRSRAL